MVFRTVFSIKGLTDPILHELSDIVREQLQFLGVKKETEEVELLVKESLSSTNRSLYFVAENSDGEIVAFSYCNVCFGLESGGKYLWINEVHTRADNRRKGIGAQLLKYIESWSLANGIRSILAIRSEVNIASRRTFLKAGFKESSTRWLSKRLP